MKIKTIIAVGALTLFSAGFVQASDSKHADYQAQVEASKSGSSAAELSHAGKYCRDNMERKDGLGGTQLPSSSRQEGDNKYGNK